jgi:hypothetical protein
MKKLTVIVSVLVLLLGAGAAWADTIVPIPNNTYIQPWAVVGGVNVVSTYVGHNEDPAHPGWYDVIGDLLNFDTFGGSFNATTGVLTINTNWGSNVTDGNNFTTKNAVCADLFVDLNGGGWDYAVALGSLDYATLAANARKDTVYSANTFLTSQDIFGVGGVHQSNEIYGGKYDPLNPTLVPVWATGSDTGMDATVTWSTGQNDPQSVTIDLSQILATLAQGDYTIQLLWATGTCANDTMEATISYHAVPLPPSALLLGTGLLGLVGLGWRRKARAS